MHQSVRIVLTLCLVCGMYLAGAPSLARMNVPGLDHRQFTVVAQDSPDKITRLLTTLNQIRSDNGLPVFINNQLLNFAAQAHVEDMVAYHNYSHTGSDGSSVSLRAARAGYAGMRGVSENWVATQDVPSAVAWWMNSYVHRGNILNPKWNEIGIGTKADPSNGMQLFVLVFGSGNQGSDAAVQLAAAPQVALVAPAPLTIPATGMEYTVRPGDTLSGVAARYGISWWRIAEVNELSENSLLRIGQRIVLPGSGGTPPTGTGGLAAEDLPKYMVQSGDTLSVIAARFDTTWQELSSINGLSTNSVLQIGQILRVPKGAATASDPVVAAKVAAAPAAQVTASETAAVAQPAESGTVGAAAVVASGSRVHIVQTGETIITIALRYGLDWKELLRRNGLDDNSLIAVGQSIRLD